MRATVASALVLAGIILCGTLGVFAAEQTIVPLTPPREQRVDTLGGPADQRVEQVATTDDAQRIGAPEPPSPTKKAASTVGKFFLGVAAAGVAVAAMAATLLFI